jgi:hypothetical protein
MANEWRGKFQTLAEHKKNIPKGGVSNTTLTRTRTGLRTIKPLKDKPTFGNFNAVLPKHLRKQKGRKVVKRVTMLNARLF